MYLDALVCRFTYFFKKAVTTNLERREYLLVKIIERVLLF
jgi:hypothetical protein